jgi:hypothetical protein
MLAKEHIDDLLQRNGNVLTNDGDKIGSIGQVYADDENGQPTWVTAKTGLFGMSESFVPLEGARVEGGDILVPYTKEQVKDAPRVDTDGRLEPDEEDRLYAHYGLSGGGRTYTEATAGLDADRREGVRLRKYVTTEPMTDDVPVDEEVRKEHIRTDGDHNTRR